MPYTSSHNRIFLLLLIALCMAPLPLGVAKAEDSVMDESEENSATGSITAVVSDMPATPTTAPSANVYAETNALSPDETRNLLALAVALGIAGMIVLEERALIAAMRRLLPERRSHPGMRVTHTTAPARSGRGFSAAQVPQASSLATPRRASVQL